MLTPWSELTLVHAVEKPLLPPEIHVPATGVPNTGVLRNVGEIVRGARGRRAEPCEEHAAARHRSASGANRSTTCSQDTPSTLDGRAHVHDFQLARVRRRVPRPIATTRPRRGASRRSTGSATSSATRSTATSTTRRPRPHASASTSRPRSPTERDADHARRARGRARTCRRSRRPDPPDVLYVVPTWTWNEQTVRGLTLAAQGRRARVDVPADAHRRRAPRLPEPPVVLVRRRRAARRRARGPAVDHLADRLRGRDPGVRGRPGARPRSSRRAPSTTRSRSPAARRAHPRPSGCWPASRASARRCAAPRTRAQVDDGRGRAACRTMPRCRSRGSRRPMTSPGSPTSSRKYFLPSGDPQKFVTHWGRDPIWGRRRRARRSVHPPVPAAGRGRVRTSRCSRRPGTR